jgi:hypothetical protein
MIADHVFLIIFLGKVGSRGIAEKKQEKGEIGLREPGRNVPLRAVNGHCLKCGYGLAWIVIQGKGDSKSQTYSVT